MRESEIAYETQKSWVHADKKKSLYVVYVTGITHSTSAAAFALNDDGLSIAKAYADHLNQRNQNERKI